MLEINILVEVEVMNNNQAIKLLEEEKSWESDNRKIDAFNMGIRALKIQEKITEIVNRQLIAGNNNYKEIYDCFFELVKIVQDNY